MKTQTTYNKVVNIAEDGEITVLNTVFKHSDNFKGATGSNFYPVSKKQYTGKMKRASVIEHLIDCGMTEEFSGLGYKSQKSYAASLYKDMYDTESFMFDTSYSSMWNELREVSGLSEKEAYIFECTGGGRCFDKDFQGNVNPELSTIIREYES